jgi:hypothetical protein
VYTGLNKGAIYERWLAILQQFNFDLQYKPAEQMQVADALFRNHWDIPRDKYDQVVSPEENDPFFPYVTENTANIKLPTGQNLVDLLHNSDSDRVYECSVVQIQDPEYDADTDDVIESSNCKKKVKRKYICLNECVNAADTVSDSAFDKSTDDRSQSWKFV